MLFGEGFLGIALVFLWIYCIVDVITSESELVRNLPKVAWVFIVLLFLDVGSIAWLILGRPRGVALVPGDTRQRSVRPHRSKGPVGPDDSPHFLKNIDEQRRLKAWEDELRRREEELKHRDDDDRE